MSGEKSSKLNSIRVAFLGPESSFSNDAAKKAFPADSLIAVESIKKVFDFVEASKADFGVIPLENSIEGSVTQTLDVLAATNLIIVGELFLQIKQCLLSKGKKETITKIFSHPQGFAQCRNYLLKNFPNVELIECASTARAAEKASFEINSAAIASKSAAKKFNLDILEEDVHDLENNKTKFAIITILQKAKSFLLKSSSTKFKTSIVFGVKDSPGSLFEAIKSFKDFGVNMTKIESRPSKKNAWEYVFFIDIEGSTNEKKVISALEGLNAHCAFVKVLGSYKSLD
ncbi:MAG: prephenate dehydratase [archaeon]|jgi:chorismate mutase/prephenate dehydratase